MKQREPSKYGVPSFRRWLVEKLKQTRWVKKPEETYEELARRLWVAPEALIEAQKALDRDRRRVGRELIEIGTRRQLARQHGELYDVAMPERVYVDWDAYCKQRRTQPSCILRSLVVHSLARKTRPAWVAQQWRYRGQVLKVPYNTKCVARTRIPLGVRQALLRKSEAWGMSMAALVRTEVVELLEGKLTRLPLIMTVRELSDDPDSYLGSES